jgi:hypothetical protein
MGAHSHAYVTKAWDSERILKASPQMPITRTLQPTNSNAEPRISTACHHQHD